MWRKVTILGVTALLAGCVSEQVHTATVGMTGTYEALRKRIAIENLGRAIDDPTATPVQFVFSQGTAQSSATSGFSGLKFPGFNISAKANEADLLATGTWTDQWTFIPVSDSSDLASLRNLYSAVIDLDAAVHWYSSQSDPDKNPSPQLKDKYTTELTNALDNLGAALAQSPNANDRANISKSMKEIVDQISYAKPGVPGNPSVDAIGKLNERHAVQDGCIAASNDKPFCQNLTKSKPEGSIHLLALALPSGSGTRVGAATGILPYYAQLSIFDAIDSLTWKNQSLDCLNYFNRAEDGGNGTLQWLYWRKPGAPHWLPHDPPPVSADSPWTIKHIDQTHGYEIGVTSMGCYDDFLMDVQRATQNTTTKSGFSSPSPTLVNP